jgi:ABC-type Fe3+ transport system substrate-binding protein
MEWMQPMGRLRAFTAALGAHVALMLAAQSTVSAADHALIDAAKKEGQVTWYTTQITNQFGRPAAEAFQKKYGIRVNMVRGDSVELAVRMLNEGRAGRMQADVFDGTGSAPALKKGGLVLKWLPDQAKRLPKEYVDQEGYWIATNIYIQTPAHNTNLVPKGTEPRTWADLADPKWKGKMAWATHATTSGAPGFVGLVLSELGEENGRAYLRDLAKQSIVQLGGSARAVTDQAIAGEYPIVLQIFNHQPVISATRGAPVDWIPINPAMGILCVAGVTKDAPHPNAGKLMVDFLASEEGQRLFQKEYYIPVDPDVAPLDPRIRPDGQKFRARFFTPEQIDDAMPHWVDVFKDIFR